MEANCTTMVYVWEKLMEQIDPDCRTGERLNLPI